MANEQQSQFDMMIGQLDRLLSEFLIYSKDETLDEANRQTIKHHAEDLIGVGNASKKAILGPICPVCGGIIPKNEDPIVHMAKHL